MAILRFTAAWCGPCQKVKPVVERIQQEHPGLRVVTYDIDTPEGKEQANLWRVSGVPTLVQVDGEGAEVARLVGAHPKGKIEKTFGLA